MSDITPEKKESIIEKIEDKAKAFVKTDKIRDPQSKSEFITKNFMRLIEKTFWFMGFILFMFIVAVMIKPELAEIILPLFTLVIGGILGFMSKDLIRNSSPNEV